ncbi:MAG: hypothetical protein AB4372_32025 [Xenococcus sp. (in: cyanobacteria)]
MSLKDKNRLPLLGVLVANALAFYFVLNLEKLLSQDIVNDLSSNWQTVVPLGGATILTTLVNGLLPSKVKARLVFWKWKNPLPSRIAFSHFAQRDQRIDFSVIERKFAPLPTQEKAQSSLWYRIYKKFCDDPAIVHVHQDFLFMRDWCGLSLISLVVLGSISMRIVDSGKIKLFYLLALIAQYLFTMISARHYGERMVMSVLALESTEGVP